MSQEQHCYGDAASPPADERALIEAALRQEFGGTVPAPPQPALPDTIGPYRIIRRIGSGGMGVVYEAEQNQPKRRVALKVIRAGIASPRLLRRLELEAAILGKLEHPGIATIFEAGTLETADGVQPYFSMELIHGEPLTAYAARRELNMRQRLELLSEIADAVQHAHHKGIIHRDLKPGNILVSESGKPKILDFGVARVTDADIQSTTLQTDIGQLIGTVPYMSPEQITGDPTEIDTRSDIYALGVVAYELLAGRLPYDLTNRMIHEAARVIREDEPKPLSSISKVFRGDVEIIIAKALEKERERRYQSAAEFGQDLQRYLRNEPVHARPPSMIYQFRLLTRRNKNLIPWAGAGVAVLGMAIFLGISMNRNAERARVRMLAASIEQLLTEGRALEDKRRWEAAEQCYKTLFDLDPTRVSFLGDIARMKKERYNEQVSQGLAPDSSLLEQAVILCDRALVAAPLDKGLWNTKGVLVKKLNRFEEAIDAYRRALALAPEYSAAWENLGVVYALAGDFQSARRHLREAAELAGTHEQQCEFPWRNLATLELHLGNPQVPESIEKALICNRADPATLRLRARMFLELPALANVRNALEDAATADFLASEKDARTKRVRALAYLANNDPENARRCAQAAIDRGDDLAAADYLILALCHARSGEVPAAREAYEKALNQWPSDLRDSTATRATAEGGVLWFDSAEALHGLRTEAERAIEGASSAQTGG